VSALVSILILILTLSPESERVKRRMRLKSIGETMNMRRKRGRRGGREEWWTMEGVVDCPHCLFWIFLPLRVIDEKS
jgi:hypothetical protein